MVRKLSTKGRSVVKSQRCPGSEHISPGPTFREPLRSPAPLLWTVVGMRRVLGCRDDG